MMAYSLSESAKAVGMTRQGVLAAINKGRISAKKNELGQWEIDPAELHRVYDPVNSSGGTESKTLTVDDAALVRELRERIAELKQERDEWKAQAQGLLEQQKVLPPGRGWLARLFGK